jgi:hypothetical protein
MEIDDASSVTCRKASKSATPYQRTVSALAETRSLMAQIDALIADHGGWPMK